MFICIECDQEFDEFELIDDVCYDCRNKPAEMTLAERIEHFEADRAWKER